jgi:hypothetical protein
MLAMLRDLSSDWSSSQRSIFAKMLAKLWALVKVGAKSQNLQRCW